MYEYYSDAEEKHAGSLAAQKGGSRDRNDSLKPADKSGAEVMNSEPKDPTKHDEKICHGKRTTIHGTQAGTQQPSGCRW